MEGFKLTKIRLFNVGIWEVEVFESWLFRRKLEFRASWARDGGLLSWNGGVWTVFVLCLLLSSLDQIGNGLDCCLACHVRVPWCLIMCLCLCDFLVGFSFMRSFHVVVVVPLFMLFQNVNCHVEPSVSARLSIFFTCTRCVFYLHPHTWGNSHWSW